MKTITLRNLSTELATFIERMAVEQGLSLNRTVLALLEKAVGIDKDKPPIPVLHHDLDHLAGTWSADEADEFDQALADQRTIDSELWE